jgi:hypothetical protein
MFTPSTWASGNVAIFEFYRHINAIIAHARVSSHNQPTLEAAD